MIIISQLQWSPILHHHNFPNLTIWPTSYKTINRMNKSFPKKNSNLEEKADFAPKSYAFVQLQTTYWCLLQIGTMRTLAISVVSSANKEYKEPKICHKNLARCNQCPGWDEVLSGRLKKPAANSTNRDLSRWLTFYVHQSH